jgi:hypothetical protein
VCRAEPNIIKDELIYGYALNFNNQEYNTGLLNCSNLPEKYLDSFKMCQSISSSPSSSSSSSSSPVSS